MPTPKRRSEATFKGGLMRQPIRGSRFPLATLAALACLTWPAPAVPATPVNLASI